MNKALLLRLHRWTALIFAAPLAAVIVTGLILSVEPVLTQNAIQPRSVTTEALVGILQRQDPQGAARSLFLRPQEGLLSLGGGRSGGAIVVDLQTGERASGQAGSALSAVFGTARRIHEQLVFGAGWLVTASTIAMLALVALGMLMGWPKLRNNLSGWHKALGWFPLPLVILSPLTGLMLAIGLTFTGPMARPDSGAPLPLSEAVRVLGAMHDLSAIQWIRPIGGALVARLYEDGEARTYALTQAGAMPTARNWPRLIHEGTWGGSLLSVLNLITAGSLLGLLGTGVVIWIRRKLKRSRRARAPVPAEA